MNIYINDKEYANLVSEIRRQIIQEQLSKPEPLASTVRRAQTEIFKEVFDEDEFVDKSRYWKLRQAVSTLTNVCRARETTEYAISNRCHIDRNATIHSDAEMQSAIDTFRAICIAARDVLQEDYIGGEV